LIYLLEYLLAGRVVRLGRLGVFRFQGGQLQRRALILNPDAAGVWVSAETLPMVAFLRALETRRQPGGEPEQRRRRVIVETPYRGDVARNMRYLRDAQRDCIGRGEAPFASHRMYTDALDDDDPVERDLGVALGFEWGLVAHATVAYTDLGISTGMGLGIAHARMAGRPVELRSLPGWASDA
jgi:hypothetical protein